MPGIAGAQRRGGSVTSPDGHITFELQTASAGPLKYRITLDGTRVVDWSIAGITIDGTNITRDAIASDRAVQSRSDEEYPTRGVHAVAHNRSRNETFIFQQRGTGVRFSLEVRAFDDGVGFRFVVPGNGSRTPDDTTTFSIPAGSVTWSHDLHGHYEAMYVKRAIEDVPSGDWAAPPMTYKLPGGAGYASITEAALTGYAGMALQADGRNGYAARLGHAHPPSYPYTLRYTAEDVRRLAEPASVTGPIQTPWRVVLVSRDLNGLVNNDIIHNLAPPPDPAIFPQGPATPWVKPGRAVWRYVDGGENTYEGLMRFTDMAAALGFEHHVVEGIWRQWTPAQLKAFVDYATERHVGIWLWKHSRDLRTPEARREFFDLCVKNGVVGAKIDFFDHEAKEVIDLYDAILHDAAVRHLMVDFHGANKPTGMDRTWPNELTREGIYGFEHRGTAPWGPHNATVPFTRFLAGGADYTPTVFGDRRRETSIAHQIATAVVFTSPLLVYGGNPQSFLDSPAVEIIKAIPATWDETVVLPPSEIGEVAVVARRHAEEWFIAAVNGAAKRSLRVTPSFAGGGRLAIVTARDNPDAAAAVIVERRVTQSSDVLAIDLREGGGFVTRLTPLPATRGLTPNRR